MCTRIHPQNVTKRAGIPVLAQGMISGIFDIKTLATLKPVSAFSTVRLHEPDCGPNEIFTGEQDPFKLRGLHKQSVHPLQDGMEMVYKDGNSEIDIPMSHIRSATGAQANRHAGLSIARTGGAYVRSLRSGASGIRRLWREGCRWRLHRTAIIPQQGYQGTANE